MSISKVIKKNGKLQTFYRSKIERALYKANTSAEEHSRLSDGQFDKVMNNIMKRLDGFDVISTETIDDFVEMALTRHNKYNVLKAYEDKRARKAANKTYTPIEEAVLAIIDGDTDTRGDNANKNIDDNASVRDYMAGTVAKSIGCKMISAVSKKIANGHNKGRWHFHDLDYSPINRMHNCDLIDVEDMLSEKGFVMGNTKIEPHKTTKFRTACNLLSQINLQVSGRQYGGQTQSWAHLLSFVENSRNNYRRELTEKYNSEEPIVKAVRRVLAAVGIKTGPYNKESFHNAVEQLVRKEIKEGVKIYQYQVLCHSSSNGQTPFVSNNLCLREAQTPQELHDLAMIIEEIFRRRIEGVQDPSGSWISPLFPKLLYWLCDGLNVKEGDPYFYLTELAAECECCRMQPDIMSEKQMRKIKQGQIIPTMGCRSLLAPIWEDVKYPINKQFHWCFRSQSHTNQYPYETLGPARSFETFDNGTYSTGYDDGEVLINFRGNTGWLKEKTDDYVVVSQPIVYGRWNNGVVTINLPHVALTAVENAKDSGGDPVTEFYKVLDERLQYIRQALQIRYDNVAKIKGKNSAILWMYGGLSRIGAEDTVGELMRQHPLRSSISVGYVGLYETCRALIGQSNTSPDGQKLSVEILKHLNDVCDKWKREGYIMGEETVLRDDDTATYLWNTHYSKKDIIDDRLYLHSYNIAVDDKIIHYIENVGGKCTVHLCNPKDVHQINYSIYGTPEESLTQKFALANRRDFGIVPYITDKDYVVNSYHIDPRERIDWADKLRIEGKYQALSSGGAISYIETEDLSKNPLAVIRILQFMNDNTVYAEINRKIGICHKCGYNGDIPLSKDGSGNFIFTCPNCGNTDDTTMDITARICGYLGKISAGNTNRGRLDDIFHRSIHTDCKEDLMVKLNNINEK